jgi:hypothetical protein
MKNLAKTHLLVADWREQRDQLLINLGKWMYHSRQESGESMEALVKKSRAVGQWLNGAMLSRLERLRFDTPDERDHLPNDPDILDILYLARYFGTNLGGVEQYMVSGEVREPGEVERAEMLARAYLSLPAEQRTQVEQFITIVAQQVSERIFPPDEQLRRPRRSATPSAPRQAQAHMPAMAKEQARLDAARRQRELTGAPTDGK